MSQPAAFVNPEIAYRRADSRLRLLIEREPGYRIFFGNLTELFWRRRQAELDLMSRPLPSWGPLFIRTGLHWSVFLESLSWHLVVLVVLVFVSSRWNFQTHSLSPAKEDLSRAIYYPTAETFPAREGSQATRGEGGSRSGMVRVTPERREAGSSPPNVRVSASRNSGLTASAPALPAPPLAATARERLTLPASSTAVIPPLPGVAGFSSLAFALSRKLVAPPPEVRGVRRWPGSSPAATVVAPAPAMRGLEQLRGSGGIDFHAPAVAGPAPHLPLAEQRAGPVHGIPGGGGTAVVAPPPSTAGLMVLAGGNGTSLSGAGRVVAPPPSVRGLRGRGTGGPGGVGDLPRGEVRVVAPPPSMNGAGSWNGTGETIAEGGALVVPPAPWFGQAHTSGGGGGGGELLSGGGSIVAPPIPGLGGNGTGGSGTGRNPLAGSGTAVLPPGGNGAGTGSGAGVGNGTGGGNAQSGAGGGNGNGGSGAGSGSGAKNLVAEAVTPFSGQPGAGEEAKPIMRSATPPPSTAAREPDGTGEVVPLRVIQLALSLPTTSYFSNYEAFVAERAVSKTATELIKLVYVFLPYQRRLTEYGINTSKTFKLRVTRDPSCDESLMNMMWPEPEKGGQVASDSKADKLPCYRTTADDYRKAMEKAR